MSLYSTVEDTRVHHRVILYDLLASLDILIQLSGVLLADPSVRRDSSRLFLKLLDLFKTIRLSFEHGIRLLYLVPVFNSLGSCCIHILL